MPQALLSMSAHERSGFPTVPTVNCIAEKDPTDPQAPVALIARPGLEDFKQVGTAPIRAMFQRAGLFANAALVMASGIIYALTSGGAITAWTGASIAGSSLPDMDAGLDADLNNVVRIATGSALFKGVAAPGSVNGVITQETFPDSGNAGATSVAFLSGHWLASVPGGDYIYYLLPGSSSWTALEFAAAEYAADPLVCIRAVGEIAWLLGSASLEGWRVTGEASPPLAPYGGLKFDIGCRTKDAAVNCRGTLIFVDNDCAVRLTDGGAPRLISTNGLTEQIRGVSAMDLRASFLVVDGHPLYVLTLGSSATWVYDLSTENWTRFSSLSRDYWRAHLHCNIGDVALAADAESNQVWRVDPERKTDGSDVFTMEFAAFVQAKEAPVPLANVELDCEVGGSPLSGQGSDPLVVLQVSRDRGKTYGSPREKGLGTTGDYTKRVRWNGLGIVRQPFGAVLKFFVSDPVVRRVSAVRFNVS